MVMPSLRCEGVSMKKITLFKKLGFAVGVFALATVFANITPAPANASANSCHYYNYNRGDSGYCVRMAQTLLKGPLEVSRGGYSAGLSLDGSFGPATQSATYKFQRYHGLKYDGVVGPQTWKKLCDSAVAPYVGNGIYDNPTQVRAFNYAHSVTC